MTTKEKPDEETMRCVLVFLALHEYSAICFPNPSSSIVSRRRTGPPISSMLWFRYQVKVASGMELAEQDRLKLEPALMNWDFSEGVMVTASGPTVDTTTHGQRFV